MVLAVRWIAGLTALIVLIQAMLIGQSLFLADPGKQVLHGWLGNAAFIAALLLAVLAGISVRRGDLPPAGAGLAVLIAILMVAQLGLGYVGRRGGWSAALHIPNGVLIVALLAILLTTSFLAAAIRARTSS